jgi:type I site-specific restriction-modification system R (restriction) subunit
MEKFNIIKNKIKQSHGESLPLNLRNLQSYRKYYEIVDKEIMNIKVDEELALIDFLEKEKVVSCGA